ncbi:hypothetical protein AMTR_s00026p00223230 [Amborella trichopoda]|uniref:Uncharacterized protein n=1 Tax=Amborella trichopoda TaxID=13333 RepID=W1PT30_AMBTC|nr:hypothetical protein AMTR_s00026p00223230 [Amborella trichopoda]
MDGGSCCHPRKRDDERGIQTTACAAVQGKETDEERDKQPLVWLTGERRQIKERDRWWLVLPYGKKDNKDRDRQQVIPSFRVEIGDGKRMT